MEAKKEFTGHKHKREESKSFTVSKVTKENVITIPMNKNEILQGLFTYIKEYLTELNKWHQQKIKDLPSKEKIIKFYNKYVHLDKEFGVNTHLSYESQMSNETFYNYSFFLVHQTFIIKDTETAILHEADKYDLYILELTTFFTYFSTFDFDTTLNENNVYSTVLKDTILCGLEDPSTVLNKVYTIISNREIIIKLENGTLFNQISENNIKKLTFDELKAFATSAVSLDVYYEFCKCQMISELVAENEDKTEALIKIKNAIEYILTNYTMYHCSMINDVLITTLGITFCEKTIILNSRLYTNDNWIVSYEKNAVILMTILHELGHALIRKYKKDNFFMKTITYESDIINKSAFQSNSKKKNKKKLKITNKATKINNNFDTINIDERGESQTKYNSKVKTTNKEKYDEGGMFIDLMTTGNCNKYYFEIAQYLLDINNWKSNVTEFRNKFDVIYNKCKKAKMQAYVPYKGKTQKAQLFYQPFFSFGHICSKKAYLY